MNIQNAINPTVSGLQPSGIRRFFDIAQSMEGVISLGVGEPDFPTPWHIRNAGISSLNNSKTRYTSNAGLITLREEISKYMQRTLGVSYDPNGQILVTVGGSEGIDAVIRTLVAPGDEVIIPQPSFVCYEPLVRLAGGVPVIMQTRAEDDFKVTPELLKKYLTDKTKMLLLTFPCNPTGAIMEKEDLQLIADVLYNTNVVVLSDEIYSELTYDNTHTSIACIPSMKERTVIINGFSKSFSMTGWRMGFACGPKAVISQATKIHQFAIMSAPTTAQYAAIEALRNGQGDIAAMAQEYDFRRRFIVDGFNKLGLTCREPKGAFYAFPCIESSGLDCDTFCEQLLYSQKVALVPGTAFGAGGEGHVRASYCYSIAHIKEALRRIECFLGEIKK
ncbi:MAG: aminotransferase class I/II-fold pyridoxal phosphate-dependent enzyme [Clostridia bacterium]|nr:aminotransferase class I/II-fold pyridoxal phosphate-dependent enzyme [Clostridia bacterium]